jgi:hypothetical protein
MPIILGAVQKESSSKADHCLVHPEGDDTCLGSGTCRSYGSTTRAENEAGGPFDFAQGMLFQQAPIKSPIQFLAVKKERVFRGPDPHSGKRYVA